MLIFLLQDTIRQAPVGFESNRKNIFDPEEEDNEIDGPDSDDNGESSSIDGLSTKADESNIDVEKASFDSAQDMIESNANKEEEGPSTEPSVCCRGGCTKRPRFDSAFCSDACGVSAVESDLLRTFYYSSDIHPSALRH
jgi:hypothetical protein